MISLKRASSFSKLRFAFQLQKLRLSTTHDIANRGFQEADNYDRTRPTYTLQSLTNFLEVFGLNASKEKINVLDLAAGTGKFTKLISLNFVLNFVS